MDPVTQPSGLRAARPRPGGRRGRILAALGAALCLIVITGCAVTEPEATAPDPATIVEEELDGEDGAGGLEGMPPECASVSIGWYPGVDIASLDTVPAGWPAPPAGSILCSTSSGGSIETAAYASSLGIEEVLAHYEEAMPAGFVAERLSGAENGTGYASLDGNGPAIAFQVRENDGGFTLAFAREAE